MNATPKQIEYLSNLFNDRGYDRAARNAFLSDKFKRPIHYLDELSVDEASQVIRELIGEEA